MTLSWFAQFKPARMWGHLKDTFAAWSHDKVPRHGAALAYYTVFSLVPLLVVIIGMIGLVFGQEAAQSYILQQIATLVGPQSAAAIKDMLQRANQPTHGLVATVVAAATLLFGASGVFGQLQDSLNAIWGVQPKEGRGIWGYVKARFMSFAALLGTGFLLLVSLVLNAALAALGKWFGGWLPAPESVLQGVEVLVSLAVITGLFAMMFKVLPDAKVAWSDVWVGAALTALLFTLGKFAIGLYLGKSDVGSAYGAAGSLVILLVWVYYSTQILLFGAEFTQVYAKAVGRQIRPSEDATVTDPSKAKDPDAARPEKTPAPHSPVRPIPRPALSGGSFPKSTDPVVQGPARWLMAFLLGLSIVQFLRGTSQKVNTHR
jgi:membrane protein